MGVSCAARRVFVRVVEGGTTSFSVAQVAFVGTPSPHLNLPDLQLFRVDHSNNRLLIRLKLPLFFMAEIKISYGEYCLCAFNSPANLARFFEK